MADAGKPVKLARARVLEDGKVTAGKGLSEAVSKSIRKDQSVSSGHVQGQKRYSSGATLRHSVGSKQHSRQSIRLSLKSRSIVTRIAHLLDVEEYLFPDEEEVLDPTKVETKLDVTALDRYNEDVRRLRKLLIDECRMLPNKGEPDDHVISKIRLTVRCLCRTSFYGTHKAQILAEGGVIMIIWLLNRRNVKAAVKVHILQSLAEMMWTSPELKWILYKYKGVRVITKLLVNGVKQKSDQARWACYTLAMTCISSADAISAVLDIDHIDEVVGEVAFYSYWSNWPANFGSILQGILFGPHSVIPMEEAFDFI